MDKEIQGIIASIDKQYGQGSLVNLGGEQIYNIERCPSGSLLLDLALGGGYPQGRVIELFGKESGGKTTAALFYIAELQKTLPDKYVAFVDAEFSLDIELARRYGVDVGKLLISQPSSGEEALNIMESLARSGKFSGIVVDSVSALVPQAEAESEMEQQSIGLQARMMSKALRKLTSVASNYACSMVFINQIREKVGVMYGNPETTSGGKALKFYSSIRIEVRPGEPIKKGDEQIGHVMNCKVVKNKTYPPFKKASFALIYGEGIDRVADIGKIALDIGLVKLAGSWISVLDENGEVRPAKVGEEGDLMKWQGKDKFFNYLRDDGELLEELESKIRDQG